MKKWHVALAMAMASLSAVVPGHTAGTRKLSELEHRILKDCDPVCELQVQDAAFSMLMEAYRQFQSFQIEQDFQARLRAASGMSDADQGSLIIDTQSKSLQTMRAWVEELARKERELRLQQLSSRVTNFRTAYNCVRRLDESDIGHPVSSHVDMRAAASELKTFRIVALGPTTAKLQTVQSSPAATIFLDAEPVDIPAEHLIAPCE